MKKNKNKGLDELRPRASTEMDLLLEQSTERNRILSEEMNLKHYANNRRVEVDPSPRNGLNEQ